MSRPLSPRQKVHIQIGFFQEELNSLLDICQKTGISRSDFVRIAALRQINETTPLLTQEQLILSALPPWLKNLVSRTQDFLPTDAFTPTTVQNSNIPPPKLSEQLKYTDIINKIKKPEEPQTENHIVLAEKDEFDD